MAGGPPLYSDEIAGLAFFFSNFASSEEASDYLMQNDKGPGTFLLRPSTRSRGTLTLTISIEGGLVRHVNVQRVASEDSSTGMNYFIIPERTFPSFHQLYAFYSINAICNLENVTNVKLLHPLHNTITTPDTVPPALPAPPPPLVSAEEIPPIPRKPSSSSNPLGIGPVQNGERSSIGRGPALPELPMSSQHRRSLDSQGNENNFPHSSGSSGSGHGVGAVSATMGSPPSRPFGAGVVSPGVGTTVLGAGQVVGAVGGHNLAGLHYIAPGSPAGPVLRGFESTNSLAQPPQNYAAWPGSSATLPSKLNKKELKKMEKEEKKRKEAEKKAKKGKDKKGKKNEMETMTDLGWCRPPIPTPDAGVREEDHPYYSSPRPYKNHLEDLKNMLRQSEICDCGLRMLDAELMQGWTVHRSRESGTYKRVFYQHENGNTTWAFPMEIAELLTNNQVMFIVKLCKEGNQDLPAQIMFRYQKILRTGSQTNTSSLNSSRSRSSSNSSDQFGSNVSLRSPNLEQRPLPGSKGF